MGIPQSLEVDGWIARHPPAHWCFHLDDCYLLHPMGTRAEEQGNSLPSIFGLVGILLAGQIKEEGLLALDMLGPCRM